ncbi:MAG: hypothetical protein P1U41_08270 [Vicingaceae bacterium]|nr:hypothetical protein [Vicingaceae bacterium]
MKKDIEQLKVENVAVAVVKEKNEEGEYIWNVYLVNQRKETLQNVLISSKGYVTDLKGNETKTSVLRHVIGNVEANEYAKIEPIIEDVFALNNEYWLSFFLDDKMYDKKYIFLAETIKKENFTTIPILNKQGVMIK